MRQQQRRQSALSWIQSGATVTIKAYTRRYGVDRYTAYEDLTAVGFSLPASAQHWAHRPAPTPRPRRQRADDCPPSTDWIMMDGRPYFVAGYTPAGFPYGIYADEMGDLVRHALVDAPTSPRNTARRRTQRTALIGDRVA